MSTRRTRKPDPISMVAVLLNQSNKLDSHSTAPVLPVHIYRSQWRIRFWTQWNGVEGGKRRGAAITQFTASDGGRERTQPERRCADMTKVDGKEAEGRGGGHFL
jgi:hypothetical protein